MCFTRQIEAGFFWDLQCRELRTSLWVPERALA
jgi:hypothetical protein